jgi:hypothetical protein
MFVVVNRPLVLIWWLLELGDVYENGLVDGLLVGLVLFK